MPLPPPAPLAAGRRPDLLPLAVCVAIASVAVLVPYHRGLRFPFALDDYTYLMPAAGLEPAVFSLRRWLGVRGWYEAMLALFGPSPFGWHVVAFALHVANAVWVFVLGRRLGATREAAWIACGLFAASPLAFTAVYWIACIQELGSTFLVLAATWCVLQPGRRWRLASVPLFAGAVLFKESVLAAPLALALVAPRARKLAAVQLAVGVALFVAAGLGARALSSDPTSPYRTAYDHTLLVNLATHLVWFLAPWRPYPDRLAIAQPSLVVPALAVLFAAAVGLIIARGRHLGWIGLAAAWFVALLLPVLPLAAHSYAYYSYAAQIGFLLLAGAGLDRLAGRWSPRRAQVVRAGFGTLVVGLSMFWAARNARTHETLTLQNSLVPYDSVVRYGRAAGSIVAAVDRAELRPGTQRIALLSLSPRLGKAAPTPGMDDRPGATRIRTVPLRVAMREGRLIALHFPPLQGAIVESLTTRDEAADTAIFFGTGFADVEMLPDASEAWTVLAQGHLMLGDRAAAEAELRRALELSPRHVVARVILAGVLLESGRRDEAERWVDEMQPTDLPEPIRPLLVQILAALGRRPAATPAP